MAAINPFARELLLKIVFYGPGLGGKTTTLQHVHDSAKAEHRGKLVSLATAVDRTLYFDFLPIRIPKTRGMSVRLQLFTVPGQVYYNATRKLVLTGADGLVFVADSQSARLDANLESLENLQENLREQKRELGDVPHVLQYNKRDLHDVLPVEELEEALNLYRAPSVATIATDGTGVFETLSLITHAVVDAFQSSLPDEADRAEVRMSVPEGGLADALRGAEGPMSSRTVSIVTENLLDPSVGSPRLTGFPETIEEPTPPSSLPAPSSATRPAPPDVLERAAREPLWEPPLVPSDRASRAAVPVVGSDETRAPSDHGVSASPPAAAEAPSHAGEDDAPPSARVRASAPPSVPPRVSSAPSDLARSVTPAARGPVFSFAQLWGEGEREVVREVEVAIAEKEHVRAVVLIDQLAARVLASGAMLLGTSDAPRDAALVPLLLGLGGARYLAFRSLVRDTRAGQEPDERTVLSAYAFVIELRLARARIGM